MSNSTEEHFPRVAVDLSIASCCLCILGSYFIIWTYIWIPEIRNPTRKLFTFLSIADSLTALGYLISAVAWYTDTFNHVCTIQSYVTTFSSLVSFNITVAIAILLFTTVVNQSDWEANKGFVYVANLVSWVIPACIVSVVGGVYQVLGKHDTSHPTAGTGPWCWIDESDTHHVVWMFVTGKGWEILCYLLTTSLYVLLKVHLHLKHRNVRLGSINRSKMRDEDQNFLYVWFVLYVLRLWGTIRFFIKISNSNLHGQWYTLYNKDLLYMQAFGDPAQGFCNFILFVLLDKTVRNKITQLCYQVLPCCRDRNENSDEMSENRWLLKFISVEYDT